MHVWLKVRHTNLQSSLQSTTLSTTHSGSSNSRTAERTAQCSLCRFELWCIVESMSCEVQQMSEYRCVAGLWPWNNAVGRAFGLTISQ